MAKLTMLFVDAATENVDAIPRRLRELGVRYDAAREQEFRSELQVLFDRYYGSRLSDIDPLQVIREGFQLIYSMNLKLPSRFVILDKAIATLASVGQEVYPEFNVFEVAKPYARGLLADRFHPRALSQRARVEALGLASIARDVPYQVSRRARATAPGHVPGAHREPGHRRDRRPHRQGDEPDRGGARHPRRAAWARRSSASSRRAARTRSASISSRWSASSSRASSEPGSSGASSGTAGCSSRPCRRGTAEERLSQIRCKGHLAQRVRPG